jgi:hypothetical protein
VVLGRGANDSVESFLMEFIDRVVVTRIAVA